MNESIKTYGTQDPVIETLSLTTSIDNTPSGTLIYTQTGTWREVMSLVPELGTRSEYFQNVEWKDAAGNDYRADLILKNISQTSTGAARRLKLRSLTAHRI